MLTERELASAIWIAGIVATLMIVPTTRKSLWPALADLVRSAAHPKIWGLFAALFLWAGFCVLAAWRIGLWDVSLLKETLLVVLGLGFPMLFRSVRAKSGTNLARQVLTASAGGTALLLFYLNLASFPLWAELLLQPFAAIIAMCALVASHKPETKKLVPFFNLILVLFLTGSVIWTSITLISMGDQTDWLQTLRAFLLTLWLPALLTPFFYSVAFVAYAESHLKRVAHLSAGRKLPLRVHLAFILGLRLSVAWASSFTGRYNGLAQEKRFRGATRFMRDFRHDVARRNHEEDLRLRALAELAGVRGVDDEGAQLDRREFQVTKNRLRWIAATQDGRYERNGGAYWDDLTDEMVDAKSHDLPEQHGFVTEVSSDRQRWRTWRPLPSGWHLAIGGAKEEGNFFYAGSEPPTTWPGIGKEWASDLRDPDLPPDWEKSDDSTL